LEKGKGFRVGKGDGLRVGIGEWLWVGKGLRVRRKRCGKG
jgi:hypothetical protein